MSKLDLMGEKAKKASYKLSVLSSTEKNHALQKIAPDSWKKVMKY